MNKLEFNEVAQAALRVIDALLAEWLPSGRYKGHEFFALNPTRNDKSLGSFCVNTNTGRWADYATGDAGGDLVSLLAYLQFNGSQLDALRALAERLNLGGFVMPEKKSWDGSPKYGNSKTRQTWTPIAPIAEKVLAYLNGSRAFAFAQNKRQIGLRATYRDRDGNALCVVQRFIDADGNKSDLPFTWCENEKGECEWRNRRLNDPQPLFGLDALAMSPEKDVLIVEGEKCKLAAEQEHACKDFVVVSWLGGCNGWKKADWSAIQNRRVLLWADADAQEKDGVLLPLAEQAGTKAMLGIADVLVGQNCDVYLVRLPAVGALPSGYDIADAIADGKMNVIQSLSFEHALPFRDFCASGVPQNEMATSGEKFAENTHEKRGDAGDFDGEQDSENLSQTALNDLLNRFAKIGLKMRFVCLENGEVLSRLHMERAFGKTMVGLMLEHSQLKQISEVEADELIKNKRLEKRSDLNELGGMLQRYIHLDGRTEAYDIQLDSVVSLAAVKASFPEFYEDWQKSPRRLTCSMHNYGFEPNLPYGVSRNAEQANVIDFINLFHGLPFHSEQAAYPEDVSYQDLQIGFPKCEKIIGLIEHLCAGNGQGKDVAEWVLNWLACRLRFPAKKPATALVFISEIQGAGKSTFGEKILKGLFGDYYRQLDQNALESKFNSAFHCALMTVFEEISPSDERMNVIGKFKNLVTADTIMIERKGSDSVKQNDYNGFAVFSNDERSIPLETNDRRYMVINCKSRLSDEAFIALENEIEAGGLQAFCDFLHALPLFYTESYTADGKAVRKRFHEHSRPLMTAIKRRMIDLNKPNWEAFLDDWWQGELHVPFICCDLSELWEVYKRWVHDTKAYAMPRKNFKASLQRRFDVKKTRVIIRGLEKFKTVVAIPHRYLKAEHQQQFPYPTKQGFGQTQSSTFAKYYGNQLEAFHSEAVEQVASLPNL